MRIKTWLNTWLPLIAAGFALVFSGYAIYADNVHYQEVTKPHAKHNEIYNMLVRLDDRIERVQQWISAPQNLGQEIRESEIILREATELRDQAELAWAKGYYAEAEVLINTAFGNLQKITPPAKPVRNWGLIGGIIAAAVVIVILLAYFLRWRRRGEDKNE